MRRFLVQLSVAAIFLIVSCSSRKIQSGTISGDVIKVMTYNVHHCNPPGKPDVIDVDAIAAVIKQQGADIAAVQEVDVHTGRSGNINQAEQLAAKAGFGFYYFGKAMDFDGGGYGVLILSRYPLTDTITYSLPMAEEKGGEPRVLAAATATLPNGRSVRFGSTHLEAYNNTSRILQIKEISRIAGEVTLPFIVAGDLNAAEGSEVIRILDADFTRTCYKCPSTFWEGNETGAIDFIVSRPKAAFHVLSHQVVQNKEASDHMPVVAALQLKQ
ncbi:endonuclease/exonuclease/phosphatase family protein [Agriterribacter sp.]|uniref:endonuclease/exonuclease/phosphatase family protein n=1 Tax=Agriterribacter sp. TaxID=2821509 RepID=UPI002CAF64C9|nr:endonuclease/exonuclease/phosphatase family protein [Agriterribacter sp.]HRP55787.1 endonuclease/exonuclease/phosphatase family protein [Agriterribacter sp.]